MNKMFKGLLDSFYKKWELYLFRLFQISKYVENLRKFTKITAPPLKEILNSKNGYEGYVRIPPNPFLLREQDAELFYMIFDDLSCENENEAGLNKLFVEIWRRIAFIKQFLGITKNTRYCGEESSERRLVNEIDVYLKHPEACSPLHSLVLGKIPEKEEELEEFRSIMKQFQNFLLDRSPIKKGEVKSYLYY